MTKSNREHMQRQPDEPTEEIEKYSLEDYEIHQSNENWIVLYIIILALIMFGLIAWVVRP